MTKHARTLMAMTLLAGCAGADAGAGGGRRGDQGQQGGSVGEGDSSGGVGGTRASGGTGGTSAAGGAAGGSAAADGGSGGTAAAGTGGAPAAANEHACMEFDVTVRDFRSDHPDFQFNQLCWDREDCIRPGAGTGMVRATLFNGKPTLASEAGFVDDNAFRQVQGAASFDQWWADAAGLNMALQRKMTLYKRSNLLDAIGMDDFYPIDNAGFGNVDLVGPDAASASDMLKQEDLLHNTLFTAELHGEFRYESGKNQLLIIESDDDSWVFINGKLAIDHGGLHAFEPASVNLDARAAELGIQSGQSYPIAVFYADRQMSGARFRLSFNVKFTKCTK